MHDTALKFGRYFFETYMVRDGRQRIIDIGAQDVRGSLRSVAPEGNEYIGVDFVAGRGVDVVITDPYALPFDDESVDICVSSSCFEHSEFFWLLFTECLRVLKPGGLMYINAPANGSFHRYPVDCWRFYPDSGVALERWAARGGFNAVLLESFTGNQGMHGWNDFVAVFLKDRAHLDRFPHRILSRISDYTNGRTCESDHIRNFTNAVEDSRISTRVRRRLRQALAILSGDPRLRAKLKRRVTRVVRAPGSTSRSRRPARS
jgi:SAM-dependent methyltransferase